MSTRDLDDQSNQSYSMRTESLTAAMEKLVSTVQRLSLARSLDEIMSIVRHEARVLTGADGATFVLRDQGFCYYADEDAIQPLWKGKRFPLETCISGWAMLNRQPAIIEDIYSDPRIPTEAYRPTFVKSLVMVPIRTTAPIGAIGNYWARKYLPQPQEVRLLQALADSTSIAMENVQLYNELEQRVKNRTLQLELINQELESFSYSVSHDLRSPLNGIKGFSELMLENYEERLDEAGKEYLGEIHSAAQTMSNLIENLLRLAHINSQDLRCEDVNLSELTHKIIKKLQSTDPSRQVELKIEGGQIVKGDPGLLEIMMENLLNNAWKYTSKNTQTYIEFSSTQMPGENKPAYVIRDNGAGFDMQHADKLFHTFKRLHSSKEFPGTGIGLTTVARIIKRHNGAIKADSIKGKGTAFYFSL
jgi:signal transduction histidine kinase